MQSNKSQLRLALYSLEHDHAWWTMAHIDEEENCKLVSVADNHSHLLAKFHQGRPDVVTFNHMQDMLDSVKPDAMIVTSANNEHLIALQECASRGIHCFVQKPMATNAADARCMAQIAQQSGIRLMVNCFPLWGGVYQTFFDAVRQGMTGEVHKFVSSHGHQGPRGIGVLTEDYLNWLYDPVRAGGGALMDQASYGLLYALCIFGRPTSVFAATNIYKPEENTAVDDDSTILLTYPKATAVVQGSYIWPFGRVELWAYGLKGGLRLYNDHLVFEEKRLPHVSENSTIDLHPAVVPSCRRNGISHFVDCLLQNKPFDCQHTVEINMLLAEVVDAAYKSARNGKAIRLE